MEQFEAIVHSYPAEVDIKSVTNAIECVKGLLKEDLAAFEKTWIIECLLSKPIELLSVIKGKKQEDAWSKVVEKSFELLDEMIRTWSQQLEVYGETIVKVCLQSYVPHVRKRGIQCVITLVKCSIQATVSMDLLVAILADFEETLSSRVPVAELIGVICERRPETVGNVYKEIWRTYLCVLETSKLPDSLIDGVLLGINGLFKEFGEELPILELNCLYDKMTSTYIHIKRCRLACYNILANHSKLFREKIIQDIKIKPLLWSILEDEKSRLEVLVKALFQLYELCMDNQNRTVLDETIIADLYPKTQSKSSQIKNTAYKIISVNVTKYRHIISEEIIKRFDRDVIEISSRVLFDANQKLATLNMADSFQFDHSFVHCMEQACWLAPLNHNNSENLFRVLILGYRWTSKRTEVIHCLLTFGDTLRSGAISFLISETCVLNPDGSKTENFVHYQQLWRDLFDSRSGTDIVVLEYAKFVFEEFLNYVTFFLESILEKDFKGSIEETRSRVSVVLELFQSVLLVENAREWMTSHVTYMTRTVLDCVDVFGGGQGMVTLVPTLFAVCHATEERDVQLYERCVDVYRSLDISRCSDEAMLCVTCLALVQIPSHFLQDVKPSLEAFKLLFSRKDVEAKMLVSSLDQFEKLLLNGSIKTTEPIVAEIINLIKNLSTNVQVSDQYGRLLKRNILLFIGKFAKLYDENQNTSKTIVLRNIKDSLFLNLPNYNDGSNYKLNLQKLLRAAILEEDAESLHSLLIILCANAESLRKVPGISGIVVCVVHKLCVCRSREEVAGNVADLQRSVLLFDCVGCVHAFLQCITKEISPGVRLMLSEIVSQVLQQDPQSDSSEEALLLIMDHGSVMMQDPGSTTKRAGLDLTLTLLESLKSNNTLTEKFLPKLIILTIKTNEKDFETTLDSLFEFFDKKFELFSEEILEEMTEELLKFILETELNTIVYKNLVVKSLNIIKYVYFHKNKAVEDIFDLFKKYFKMDYENKIDFAKTIFVLSNMCSIFNFDIEVKRMVIQYNDFVILNEALKRAQGFYVKLYDVHSYFLFESFLEILIQFSDVLLEFKYQNTLELLSILITTLPVLYVKRMYKKIEICMDRFRSIWRNNQPHIITNSIHMWLKSQQIIAISDQLKNCIIPYENVAILNGIKLMLRISKLNKNESIFCDEIYEKIKSWVNIIMGLYSRQFYINDKSKMAALSDCVVISLFFLSDNELIKLLIHSQNIVLNAITFYQKYIGAFTQSLLYREVLSDERLAPCLPVLLYEMLIYLGKKNCTNEECEIIVNFIDKNWNVQERDSMCMSIIRALSRMSPKQCLTLKLRPATYLLTQMATPDLTLSQRIIFMETLTGFLGNDVDCELLGPAILRYTGSVPQRASELCSRSDPRALTALLDALAAQPHALILDAVNLVCLAEERSGWWDDAIDQCMLALSTKSNIDTALAIFDNYKNCQMLTVKPISHMLVPLLRYSTSKYNEEFFSKTLGKIVECLRRTYKEKTNNSLYCRMIVKQTACFMLLQVMFQNVSAQSLESPTSTIYSSLCVTGRKPWWIAAEVCGVCVTLRTECAYYDDDTLRLHRQFQCSNYNCMVSVLTKRKPALKFYEKLFVESLWPLIFDCHKHYNLYIDAKGKSSKKRHIVPPSMEGASVTSRPSSLRSHNPLFLRTMSDNPLQYDLLEYTPEEQVTTQEIILRDNELNSHPCVSSISALLCHLSTLTDDSAPYWITKMADTIMAENTHVNVKWFLSQIIVNGEEELCKYCSLLMRPLADVVINTVQKQDGQIYLNGLHIDILRTIHRWSDDQKLPGEYITWCVELLIDTCYYHKSRKFVRKSVLMVLGDLVKVYGGCVRVLLDKIIAHSDDVNKEIQLELLILLTKNNIYIPGLLKYLTNNLKYFDTYSTKTIELSQLYGLAVKTCQSEAEKSDNLRKFHAFLDKKRSNIHEYIKILFYAQRECHECVDAKCFNHITDIAPTMISANKNKCYTILSNYISHVQERDDYIQEMFACINIPECILGKDPYIGIQIAKNGLNLLTESLRKQVVFLVCDVCENANASIRNISYELLLKAYIDASNEQSFEPSAKRRHTRKCSQITDCVSGTDLYIKSILSALGMAIIDPDKQIYSLVFVGFLDILDKNDLGIRLCEIIALTMVLPFSKNNSKMNSNMAAGKCLVTAVKLWLHALRNNDSFKVKLLRDHPIDISTFNDCGPSKLLTMSKTYQGTFRSNSVIPSRSTRKGVSSTNEKALDVLIPVDQLLQKFIHFAENNVQAGCELFLEIVRLVQSSSVWARVKSGLCDLYVCMLRFAPPVMLPIVLQLVTSVVGDCVSVPGFISSVEGLKTKWEGSEAEILTKILYEETMLRTNQDIVLSPINEEDFTMLEEPEEFSINDLSDIFGKLSNWDDLTLQKRSEFKNGSLPKFWTDDETFSFVLGSYTDTNSWISKVRDVYIGNTNIHFDWLKKHQNWPTNLFDLSTLTEAIDIKSRLDNEEYDYKSIVCGLNSKDCLALWALRLMLRSTMTKQLTSNSDSQTTYCRKSELKWCEEANRRGLDTIALQCIQRNTSDLCPEESLWWLFQQVLALRSRGSRLNRPELMEMALHKSETYLSSFKSTSDSETVFAINKVILQLKNQLNALNQDNLEVILTEMCQQLEEGRPNVTQNILSHMLDSYKIAYLYYCDILDTVEEAEFKHTFKNAVKILKDIINMKLTSDMYGLISCALHHLDKITDKYIYEECAVILLDVLEDNVQYLNDIILEELKRIMSKFPDDFHKKYISLHKRLFEESIHTNMSRLKLLRCPEYTLEQYVTSLLNMLQNKDASEWNNTFLSIHLELYTNQEGSSYRLLNKYKTHLDTIQVYDTSEKWKQNAERVLKNIFKNLKSNAIKYFILLEDLCPILSDYTNMSERDRRCIEHLLGVPKNVYIVRFEKQLKVFTNSVKRPVLVRSLLSNGKNKSFLIKCAEDLRTDSACQAILLHLDTVFTHKPVTYKVSPLGKDAGVIEYLEDNETVRQLLSKYYTNINEIATNRVKDEQLILQSQNANMNQYKEICNKIPSYALRSCIINESESLQDFVMKQNNFLNTLSTMTLVHWILGLGDRHLENILYNNNTGEMCSVDWAAILDHTVHSFTHSPELMPARVTRNFLAVIPNVSVLESRLQDNLTKIREDHKILSAVIRVAFSFMDHFQSDGFQEKLKHIENKITGAVLPFHVTKSVLRTSNLQNKQQYIDILDDLFDNVLEKDKYSVEEQVYYLLRQCTEDKILAVTRSGWEPCL